MSFIAKNPLIVPEIKSSSVVPKPGTRGLFASRDGWYEVASDGSIKKIATNIDVDDLKERIDSLGDGKDGVSVTHSWNGTTLTVTSASGTSSSDLKGDKGDIGEKGADGADGKNGADGYTPVRGTDYWTEADKTEIKSYINETANQPITTLSSLIDTKQTNKIYALTVGSSQLLSLPNPDDKTIQNQILIYLTTTNSVSISWNATTNYPVVFVNDEIPTIGVGNYRIIFEFHPVMKKWVAGVIQDGAVE